MSEKLLERLNTLIELDRNNLVKDKDNDGHWYRKKDFPKFLGNNKKEYSFQFHYPSFDRKNIYIKLLYRETQIRKNKRGGRDINAGYNKEVDVGFSITSKKKDDILKFCRFANNNAKSINLNEWEKEFKKETGLTVTELILKIDTMIIEFL